MSSFLVLLAGLGASLTFVAELTRVLRAGRRGPARAWAREATTGRPLPLRPDRRRQGRRQTDSRL